MNIEKYKSWMDEVIKPLGWDVVSWMGTDAAIDNLIGSVFAAGANATEYLPNEFQVVEAFSKDWWKKELLLEGGAYGHLNHPFDNKNLTFSDFKTLIINTLQGNLDKEGPVTEKTDGQNIMISWKNGKFVKKYLNPNDLQASSNLINLGIKLSGKNYSYSNNKSVLFYDKISNSMKECEGSIVAGTCSKYKPFDMRSYNFDTLYYNASNGRMQKCGNASMGRCLSFRPQPSIISNNQLFYNPRTKSMSKCLNSTNNGRCLAFGMPPIKMNSGYSKTSPSYNSYFKRVPQPDELLELGLRMMSGACTLGRNCL